MKHSLPLIILLLLQSCISHKINRELSSNTEANEFYDIDPKFEEFEGGSYQYEEIINNKLIDLSYDLMKKMYNKKSTPDGMTRDAHAKSHGCLKASFEVDNKELPNDLKIGLFSKNKSYDAWVRFSNNDHLPLRRDNEYDLRGMSIKVMAVEGKKIMPDFETAPTQDFLLYGSNVFFIKNNEDYIEFIKGLRDDNAAVALIMHTPLAALKTRRAQFKMYKYKNPLNAKYFSAVPIRLGKLSDENRRAIKYSTKPCSGTHTHSVLTKVENHDYMRKNMETALNENQACFEFQIQLQNGSNEMPVEDSTVVWSEKTSPYIKVAKIIIEKQIFNTVERDKYCENLSFTPWHSLLEHKPLGRTMRMRRDIYKATSDYRRTTNNAIKEEPSLFLIE